MADKHLPHLMIPSPPDTISYQSKPGRGSGLKIPFRKRADQYNKLKKLFEKAWKDSADAKAVSQSDHNGIYIEFRSEPGFDLVTKSLEDLRSKQVRLLNVRQDDTDEGVVTYATVFVANEHKHYFLKKLDAYGKGEFTARGNPKNQNLINSISDIRKAILASFWMDDPTDIPSQSYQWCEIWLKTSSDSQDHRVRKSFEKLLKQIKIEAKPNHLDFPERCVKLVYANRENLENLISNSGDIAEIRNGADLAFMIDQENWDQAEWVKDLLDRIRIEETNTSVCILDTGINNGHPLLKPVLRDSDMQAVDGSWNIHDHDGHGTKMAGTAAYGNMFDALQSSGPVILKHALESVKILPPPPKKNPKEVWGDITMQGVYLAESQAPFRMRIICSAITALVTRKKGRPSSWSAAIDKLASGADDNHQRIIIQAAGNLSNSKLWHHYPQAQQNEAIHDPAQAWNCITVGASTQLVSISDPSLKGFKPIASRGGLSPFTTTSITWDRIWPLKPDIVMEGGNAVTDDQGFSSERDELSLVTTNHNISDAHFIRFNMTSAASAHAACFAAKIQSQYPNLWPETIRALMIHSAKWTDQLKKEYLGSGCKSDYIGLMRACGYGVPDLADALNSASNSVTLLIQETIQPFAHKVSRTTGQQQSGYKSNEMHCFELPWPSEILSELGETQVSMRVTLSYFIEPSPGELGWKDRYRYASHGLRFDVKSPLESKGNFLRRINHAMKNDDEQSADSNSSADFWTIGSQCRNRGSIHSDIWQGSAIQLADSNIIAVYPCIGWWRERPSLERGNRKTRYALVVTINTEGQDVDIYTAIENKIKIPVGIPGS